MKKFLTNFFNQLVPVMIGVYLGFALNNFGEQQKLKKHTDTFLAMLKTEIEANKTSIGNVRPYHLKLTEDLGSLLKEKSVLKAVQDYNFTGLRPGFTNRSAYDTGIQTGIIQELNLNLIQQLNLLYAYQQDYKSYNENILNNFIAAGYPQTENEFRKMLTSVSMSLNDVNGYELKLLETYDEILKDLSLPSNK